MLSTAMKVLGLLDKFSQRVYMAALLRLLSFAGVKIAGRPLWISPSTYIDRAGGIYLGDRCVVSHRVSLLTHDFSLDRVAEKKFGISSRELSVKRPIKIGDRVFIGMGAMILPGTSIGEDSIIGSGAVVTRDVEAGQVVAGNPARVIGSVDEYWDKRHTDFSWSNRRR